MRRWRIFMVLSALALAVELGVWALSRFVWPDAVTICIGMRRVRWEGGFHFICGLHDRDHGAWYYRSIIPYPPTSVFNNASHIHSHKVAALGNFQYIGYWATSEDWYYAVGLPFWFVTLVLASGLAVSITKVRRLRQLHGEGCCVKCGYDLRASKDRCPECGIAIAAEKPQVAPAIGEHSAI
jgi:hypothetical protein